MNTCRLINIWLLTLAVTLFFHSPLLAYSGLGKLPYCLQEGTGLLQAEAVTEIDADIDEATISTIISTPNLKVLPGILSDVPTGTNSRLSTILRI
jgi:hypothetical protein